MSQLSVKYNRIRNKSFQLKKTEYEFLQVSRRKSCYCSECGKLGSFQLHHSHLPTLKEIQILQSLQNTRKPSFCDEIRTEIPSELSLIESENGRILRRSNRSISIAMRNYRSDQMSIENHTRIKRKSCECSECGIPTQFQRKHEDLHNHQRGKKFKQFLIRKSKQGFSQRKIHVQKSIMSSPQSQKSFQVRQLDSSRRTQNINKLIMNRISTRDLEIQQIKPQQSKYSIVKSCRQLDSPQLQQTKSQRSIIHKPAMSFCTISTSKWKSYKTKEFQ